MNKHTPGPWKVLNSVQIHDEKLGGVIAACCRYARHDAVDHANAKLIAAAPDLLEALIRARDDLNNAAFLIRKELGEHHWLYDIEKGKKIADEAIAKARTK